MGKTTIARILSRQFGRIMIVDPMSEYSDTVLTPTAHDALVYMKHNKKFRISIEDGLELENFIKLAWCVEDVCLHIEEIDLIANNKSMPFPLENIIKRGRHRNISLIGTSRRPAEISRLFTSQSSDFYIFNTSEPRDISYIESYTSAALKDTIQKLPALSFIHYCDAGIQSGHIIGYTGIEYYPINDIG